MRLKGMSRERHGLPFIAKYSSNQATTPLGGVSWSSIKR